MTLFQRWKQVRCTGRNRNGRSCTHIAFEVEAGAPKLRYRFRCKKCGAWNTVEV